MRSKPSGFLSYIYNRVQGNQYWNKIEQLIFGYNILYIHIIMYYKLRFYFEKKYFYLIPRGNGSETHFLAVEKQKTRRKKILKMRLGSERR